MLLSISIKKQVQTENEAKQKAEEVKKIFEKDATVSISAVLFSEIMKPAKIVIPPKKV